MFFSLNSPKPLMWIQTTKIFSDVNLFHAGFYQIFWSNSIYYFILSKKFLILLTLRIKKKSKFAKFLLRLVILISFFFKGFLINFYKNLRAYKLFDSSYPSCWLKNLPCSFLFSCPASVPLDGSNSLNWGGGWGGGGRGGGDISFLSYLVLCYWS